MFNLSGSPSPPLWNESEELCTVSLFATNNRFLFGQGDPVVIRANSNDIFSGVLAKPCSLGFLWPLTRISYFFFFPKSEVTPAQCRPSLSFATEPSIPSSYPFLPPKQILYVSLPLNFIRYFGLYFVKNFPRDFPLLYLDLTLNFTEHVNFNRTSSVC